MYKVPEVNCYTLVKLFNYSFILVTNSISLFSLIVVNWGERGQLPSAPLDIL